MKELELTSNAALTDAVYETALNGSFLEVKLVAGSVGDDEPRGMQPEYECYHISYPDKKDTILFEQPLDAADDKVTVYDLGKKIKSIEGCCHKTLTKGESRTATARKVVAHGPMWIYVAIAVGMDKAGTESPFMIVQGAGTYGSEDTTENEMIGYANGRIHEMTALLVRRARLEKLHLASIRAGYKYLFVEPGRIGKAKVKTLSKILCKWKQDSAVSLFLYLDSVFKNKHKLIHNQAPVMNRLCPFLLNLHK